MEHMKKPQRWVSRPIVVEAVPWTGHLGDLPDEWAAHPNIELDERGLAVTTIEGLITRPRVGDYIVRGTGGEFYWVPLAIFAFRYGNPDEPLDLERLLASWEHALAEYGDLPVGAIS